MKTKTAVVLLIFILGGIFWSWWHPGPRVANDFSQISQILIKSQASFPQTWSIRGTEGLGEYTAFTLWSWPLNFLQGILANFSLSFGVLQRIVFIIPFLLIGSLGIWKLCATVNLSNYAKVAAIIFYLTNTYILLVIDGGQLSISLAFALFPLAFFVLKKAIGGNLKKKILAGLTISALGFLDIRFLYVFSFLILINFLYELFFISPKDLLSFILKWIKTGFVVSVIILGLNFYWILLLIKYPLSSDTYALLTKTSFTSFISLSNALFLFSPHWYKNVFGDLSKLQFEFVLIPILVFLAPILKKKNKFVGFWLFAALIAVFLTKGSAEPLAEIYQWFYNNIPGFSLFRDSSKFFFLVALSYSLLIGVTVDEIVKRVKDKIKVVFTFTLLLLFVVMIKPVWLNLMTGTFSLPPFEKEYSQINKLIEEDKFQSNVLWIPTISPLTLLNANHPSLDATRLAQRRPFIQANKGTYELFNFLREAPYMGQLFDISNIGYIAYPLLDIRRDNLHPDNVRYYYTFLNQLSKLPWLSKVEDSSVPLFKVKNYQERLFLAPNIWIVLGSDAIYSEATKSAKLALSKNAFLFLEESGGLSGMIDKLPNSRIVLRSKNELDLKASLIEKKELIFPSRQLNRDPDFSGWWKRESGDLFSFKDFLLEKYGIILSDFDLGGGWAVGEGRLKLKLRDDKFIKGQRFLVRAMESSRSGSLRFYQNDKLIGEVTTQSKDTNIRWFEAGILGENNEIEVVSEGDINLINALVSVSEAKMQEYKDRTLFYQGRQANFEEASIEVNQALLKYEQLSPTQYKVIISGLTKPQALIFAQNFDKRWKLNNKPSFPVYSFLNGFYIEKDGEYILEYEPQKSVYLGLIVSTVTLSGALILLFKPTKPLGSKL